MREEYNFSNAKKKSHASQLKKQVGDAQKSWPFMKAEDLDHQFDDGDDITASLDLSKAKRVLQNQKRVNVDFPNSMIDSLDSDSPRFTSPTRAS